MKGKGKREKKRKSEIERKRGGKRVSKMERNIYI